MSPAAPDHTFLFADLAGFTALTEAMGDESAADLAGEFCDAVRRAAGEHAADAVKTIDDAMMLRGTDAGEAILLGLRVVNDFGGQHYRPTVRVGMHTGPAASLRAISAAAAERVASGSMTTTAPASPTTRSTPSVHGAGQPHATTVWSGWTLSSRSAQRRTGISVH